MQVKAVVVPQVDSLHIETITLAPPGPDEVLVQNHAAGVCHSDLHTLKGHLRVRPPLVLGHEGSGIIAEVGAGVSHVKPGDHVVYNWLPSCNGCPTCLEGRPNLCETFPATILQGLLPHRESRIQTQDGSPLKHHLGVATMSEYMVTHAKNVIPCPEAVPMPTSAIVGCAVITGMGAVWNTAQAQPGRPLAVIGCGGVGLSAIMGAKVAGCSPVIGVDVQASKLEFARDLGADLTLNAAETDVVEGLKDLTRGGPEYVIDTVGAATMNTALQAARPGGTVVVVGMHAFQEEIAISPAQLVAMNRRLLGSFVGSSAPYRDIPRILQMQEAGLLHLDRLVSKTYPFQQVQTAFDDMVAGEVARGVLTFAH